MATTAKQTLRCGVGWYMWGSAEGWGTQMYPRWLASDAQCSWGGLKTTNDYPVDRVYQEISVYDKSDVLLSCFLLIIYIPITGCIEYIQNIPGKSPLNMHVSTCKLKVIVFLGPIPTHRLIPLRWVHRQVLHF